MFDAIDFKWNDEDNAIKASIPLISEEELRIIDNNFDNIVNQFIKQLIQNKDIAIAQHITRRQQAELEKKDIEITKLKKHNKDLLRKLRNRVKEVKKLTKYSLYKKEFAKLNREIEKKDKIIDLMADFMISLDIDETICKNSKCISNLINNNLVHDCKNCIKQYFEERSK